MSPVEVLLVGLVVGLIIGMPVFIALGAASCLAFAMTDEPLTIIPTTIYQGMDQFSLLAIPMFILAGTIMEKTGLTEDIVGVFLKLLGRMRGGLGVATIISCMFFSALNGSGPGTTAAVGAVMIPAMIRRGYGADYAGAVSASGGTLGILIPPSVPMIIYGVLANVSIGSLFIAGLLPGLLIGTAHVFVAYYVGRRANFGGTGEPFNWIELAETLWRSKAALGAPFVILGGIYGGIFTAVEASVIAVLYAILAGRFVYRRLGFRVLSDCVKAATATFGPLAMLIGTSLLFGKLLVLNRVPELIVNYLSAISQDPFVVVLIISGCLLIIGMFMETLSTIMILTPILVPVLTKLDVDLMHFGIIFVVTNEVAFLTPPVGVNLFVAVSLAKVSLERVAWHALPHVIAIVACLVLIAYYPSIATWLPQLVRAP